ncbi:HET-domain-containing protein [Teratosphaeria destructans]|uniref:HET-domain-containing protein n=1 Tax=Teratosphaeria destructans TaxID=418781 RepID=A0A9W7SZR8_9PEZI|nr:HET-domain-containing protein [Teratosphaeria destructans]
MRDASIATAGAACSSTAARTFYHQGGRCDRLKINRSLNSAAQEFRLLELLPGSGEESICWILRHKIIGDCPYQCLSYAWGERSSHTGIQARYQDAASDDETCDYAVQVTPNLHAALRHLRPEAGLPRTIWIDAICIDQENLNARTEQVSLMREIYSRAGMTVVWLGNGGVRSRESIEDLNKIADVWSCWSTTSIATQTCIGTSTRCIVPLPERLGKNSRTAPGSSLSSKTTGSRDCGSSPRPIARGPSQCSLVPRRSHGAYCSASIGASTPLHEPPTDRRMLLPAVYSFLFQDESRTDDIFGFTNAARPRPRDVLGLLVRAIDLDCSDPRDKVFAILGLAAEDTEEADAAAAASRLVQPGYGKDVVRVFADFTRWTWQPQTVQGRAAPGRPSWSFWYDGRSARSKATLGLWSKEGFSATGATAGNCGRGIRCG